MLYLYVLTGLLVACAPAPSMAQTSPLARGVVVKMSIPETGVYRVDGSWLSQNAIIPSTDLLISEIRLFSNFDGPVPKNGPGVQSNLSELSFYVADGGDGRLDEDDYILFYARDQDKRTWNEQDGRLELTKNIYETENYVFLVIGNSSGRTIPVTSPETPSNPTDLYRSHQFYHKDEVNLLGLFTSTQGSGQRWFGQEISNQGVVTYSHLFSLEDLNPEFPIEVETSFVIRSARNENISLSVGGETLTEAVLPVQTGDVEALHARVVQFQYSGILDSPLIEIESTFDKSDPSARAWHDYMILRASKSTLFSGPTMHINNQHVLEDPEFDGLLISGDLGECNLWDVSNALNPVQIDDSFRDNGFKTPHDQWAEYLLFDPNQAMIPGFAGITDNQSLTDISEADMIVIYHSSLQDAAKAFIEHRKNHSGLRVVGVSTEEVYNEYSSGRQDPTAIRNFCRQVFIADPEFKHLLLFGDASYDYRGLLGEFNQESLVPTYETRESLDPLLSFPSDDYFALLDDLSTSELGGDLDISVGRITARTPAEAQDVVQKIVRYDLGDQTNGDWKMRIAFLADDEDNNLHLNDADRIASEVASAHPLFNQEKIYWDAFQQESTPGGNRYPAANDKLNNEIERGLLVVNYLGHGGPRGWSQERVLHLDDIDSWSNVNRLPLVITATCSFTGFDDPALTTAGELALLNPVGGAIALFTTVRSVFASKNFRLTRSVFREIFETTNGSVPTIGQILLRAKNQPTNDNINSRKFLLIGDPSMRLALPGSRVRTTIINDRLVEDGIVTDTVGALEAVRIEGEIVSVNGEKDENFNGLLNFQVFDKSAEIKTLQNDPGSLEKSFEVQKNVIYRGLVSVENGVFHADFRIPLDINYSFGKAKISYYAEAFDGRDAGGASTNLVIGGSADQIPIDDTGPQIQLYLNSESFRSGDETTRNPLLIVLLEDDFGINLSSSSIGHEIVAVLDDNTQNTFILNELFSPLVDDPTRGRITFPLRNLELGWHQIKVKAFDISNNPGEQEIEFLVVENRSDVFGAIMNYPNPFKNKTTFRFDHSLGIASFAAQIDVFDLSGHLVHSIEQTVVSENGRIDGIEWNGVVPGLGKINNGIYLFQISLKSPDLENEVVSRFEKMIILK